MAEAPRGRQRQASTIDNSLNDIVFSWSIQDIYEGSIYTNQVEKIPERFPSVVSYVGSFEYPLLEETREELRSSMDAISTSPSAIVTKFVECKPYGKNFYEVTVGLWRYRSRGVAMEPQKMLPRDILILCDSIPETAADLQRVGSSWAFASVTKMLDNEEGGDSMSVVFKVYTGRNMGDHMDLKQRRLYAVLLSMNLTTNARIWTALRFRHSSSVLKKVLCIDSPDEAEECSLCTVKTDSFCPENSTRILLDGLNESQEKAVISCLRKVCCQHKPSIDLIWGPPGTGKTKTTSAMLMCLLKMKRKTVICAPTNVAVVEVASRVLKLLEESVCLTGLVCLGDIILFGNKGRLKLEGSDVEEIYLDDRIDRIFECTSPTIGLNYHISSAITFLSGSVSQYRKYPDAKVSPGKSFAVFLRNQLWCILQHFRRCLSTLCSQISASHVPKQIVHNITELIRKLEDLHSLLTTISSDFSKTLEEAFSRQSIDEFPYQPAFNGLVRTSYLKKNECIYALKSARDSLNLLTLPKSKDKMMEFCLQSASLIFCTVSNSFKLHSVDMEPPEVLVIDEAAQLKECESVIPLQIPGLKHAILIGDERQLPSLVKSQVSKDAHFGRSLFERLSFLGKPKNTYNVQYRMHPSISCFPNRTFYNGQLLDGLNATDKFYAKRYLPGPMFGIYSFINISEGREEREDNGSSLRNLVEADVAALIVDRLHKEWCLSKGKLSVGVIAPYAGQVTAINERLGKKYEDSDSFVVMVNTVDGFQGKEQDIIILSTVRSNSCGSIGFLADWKRTNVALTRARYALWILGNQRTMRRSSTIWEEILHDAIIRRCFFTVSDDEEFANMIVENKIKYNQTEDLLYGGSALFRNSEWKVIFGENFGQSFRKLTPNTTKTSVIKILKDLSCGRSAKQRNMDFICEQSTQIVKIFVVNSSYAVFCTVDIIEKKKYFQVLKFWDVLPLEQTAHMEKRLESFYMTASEEYIKRCKEKRFRGDLQVPIFWQTPFDFHRQKHSSGSQPDEERPKVNQNLLLMKFYSMSLGTVKHLLSDLDGNEVQLPFKVTDEQREIVQFSQSTFLLGRSGTGKTTVLTMKLLQRERIHWLTTSDYGITKGAGDYSRDKSREMLDPNKYVLRQVFITVSSKLCGEVRQQLSQLKSYTCGENLPLESSSAAVDFSDKADPFGDIPDSFADIPPESYPLVITYLKFLMMLDGSIGDSYFQRFQELRDICSSKVGAARSLALQDFMHEKEVHYERFCTAYWPHFSEMLTKNLDPSRVFTEIISHIKGGLQVKDSLQGRLSRTDYVSLSDGRNSLLTKSERRNVYEIFLNYEKRKRESGEFDLSDIVNDLHLRLRSNKLKGDCIDYVYIDEVQDLTMRQISLFKYVCDNVEEGFVFSGDTAQTIGRGIDFKFEDVRSLFFSEFMKGAGNRGKISKIFQLSQNFRTHAGILNLAKSVADLLFHFFPTSVDVMKAEMSRLCGEAPIFHVLKMDRNAIASTFGLGGNNGGLGEGQVIIVRDDRAREEVLNGVGMQVRILTILECKGLEFQDVILYDFFGSSAMDAHRWRVLYKYMKGKDLIDDGAVGSYPQFNPIRHNILCSELKQLYVAITRARMRLWICESSMESAGPMVNYWSKLELIQTRCKNINSCRMG